MIGVMDHRWRGPHPARLPHLRGEFSWDGVRRNPLGDESGNRTLDEDVILPRLSSCVVCKSIEPLVERSCAQIGVT